MNHGHLTTRLKSMWDKVYLDIYNRDDSLEWLFWHEITETINDYMRRVKVNKLEGLN